MNKAIGIKKLLAEIEVDLEKLRKMSSDSWHQEYTSPFGEDIRVEFAAKNFAEEFMKLSVELQGKLLSVIVGYVKDPGDVLVITNDKEETGGKMNVRVIRLNSEFKGVISLLITR